MFTERVLRDYELAAAQVRSVEISFQSRGQPPENLSLYFKYIERINQTSLETSLYVSSKVSEFSLRSLIGVRLFWMLVRSFPSCTVTIIRL